MKNIWFNSDLHLSHANIIKYCKRPFVRTEFPEDDKRHWDYETMDETLVKNHNELVGSDDDVYNLGDLTFGRDANVDRARQLLRRMNGRHHFIFGNHDKIATQLSDMFVWMKHYHEFKQGEITIILFHYALRTWNHQFKGSMHLYGHSHGTLPEDKSLSFDVGVDTHDFRPYHLDDIIKKMERKRRDNSPGLPPGDSK